MYSQDQKYIEHIRERPTMYLGSTGFFGLINYLVCPINLLLQHAAKYIHITIEGDAFDIQSDADIRYTEQRNWSIAPFEGKVINTRGFGADGMILNALSSFLDIETVSSSEMRTISYRQGERIAMELTSKEGGTPSTHLRFSRR